jgi:hypothetical protein
VKRGAVVVVFSSSVLLLFICCSVDTFPNNLQCTFNKSETKT